MFKHIDYVIVQLDGVERFLAMFFNMTLKTCKKTFFSNLRRRPDHCLSLPSNFSVVVELLAVTSSRLMEEIVLMLRRRDAYAYAYAYELESTAL